MRGDLAAAGAPATRSECVKVSTDKVPAGKYLCVGCFNNVDLSDCLLIHLNDGFGAQSGHWREGKLCGPVLQTDREPEDLPEHLLDRWKPFSIQ